MIKLTETVKKGGCAAKVSALELRKILSQVKFPPNDSNVLVDGGLFDDAAIYRVSEELALVQTLDFFTPIVNSPKIFGQIAAANALSDVYAMGGNPKTALAILAFPLAELPNEIAVEVLQGASNVMAQAKVNFVGGHSIDDETLKFGLSVTGFVDPRKTWTNAGARAGDHLILTKALGTGTATAALKRNAIEEVELKDILESMSQINEILPLLEESHRHAIHAATDITGFGLAGHGMQMALASQKTFKFNFSDLPVFPLCWEFLSREFLTKAHSSNAQYTRERISVGDVRDQRILFDPQTSGGLLLSVDPRLSHEMIQRLQLVFPNTRKIGEVFEASDRALYFL